MLDISNSCNSQFEYPYLKTRVVKAVVFLYGLRLDDGEKEVA